MVIDTFKELRKELKLSQLDVAIMLNVSRNTYNKWEQDPMSMPVGKLVEVSDKLNKLKERRDNELDTSNGN